jgi:hypothetical protein
MPSPLRLAGAAALSIVLGLFSAYLAVRSGFAGGEISNGPWRTSFVTGSRDADMYTRARVAVGGLLALAPFETVYWTAERDGAGQPLDARCDYQVAGVELPARWWSVTLYAADQFLTENETGRYSFSQTTLRRPPGGPWTMLVSSEPAEAKPSEVRNWLPSGKPGATGPFSLTLRLYNPKPLVYKEPEQLALPSIERGACR